MIQRYRRNTRDRNKQVQFGVPKASGSEFSILITPRSVSQSRIGTQKNSFGDAHQNCRVLAQGLRRDLGIDLEWRSSERLRLRIAQNSSPLSGNQIEDPFQQPIQQGLRPGGP